VSRVVGVDEVPDEGTDAGVVEVGPVDVIELLLEVIAIVVTSGMVVAELAVVVELLLEVIAIVVTSGMVVAELAVVVADAVFVIVVDDKLTEDEANVVEASVVIELLVVECPGIAAVVIEGDGVLEV